MSLQIVGILLVVSLGISIITEIVFGEITWENGVKREEVTKRMVQVSKWHIPYLCLKWVSICLGCLSVVLGIVCLVYWVI
ncbi:hypothetical protein [Bacillus thuringiensis]|uniref:hypothetical protein n=1 Tax=Bacillus thuringiensis TaxID=1428 RepID=UPI000BFB664C|nr:hypothetical protein [Bacillus thuringiensis]PGT90096.1 hypothetical protein COD17_10120 [Bacillus thuringiensis]